MLLEPDTLAFDAKASTDKVKKYALANDLVFTVTGLLSGEEFLEKDKFELSEGYERYSAQDRFDVTPQGRSSVEILFDIIRDENHKTEINLFRISRSIVKTSQNRYLFWKIEDVLERVPSLEDEGIREKVVEAWKMMKARELSEEEKKDNVKRQTANQRAEELAEHVRKSGLAMSEALLGKTVNGNTDSGLIDIPPNSNIFSWLRLTPNLNPGPRQRQEPTLSIPDIDGIETPPGVGYEFFETVFEKMKDGEIGVAFNADKSLFYVVRVLNRTPASNEGEQELLNRFLREKLFSSPSVDPTRTTYDQMQADGDNDMFQLWFSDFQRKYNIRFHTNVDAPR